MNQWNSFHNKIAGISSLEQLSAGNTVIHRLHPACKLLASFTFILTVLSFNRYAFGRLIPYIFYPAILMALSETPHVLLLKRFLFAVPFCLFIGLSNVFLERNTAFAVGNIFVSYGFMSFSVILFRAYLCVMAALLLIAVTPFAELAAQLRSLRIPGIFITTFEMTFRYIDVLLEETASMRTAYALRGSRASRRAKGVDIRHAGSFIGCLLLRSFDRAERIYSAMKCRGYALCGSGGKQKPFTFRDALYCVIVCSFSLFFRFVDAGRWMNGLVRQLG